MLDLTIVRRCDFPQMGTIGTFQLTDSARVLYEGYTIEEPWRDNERYTSCIPVGKYRLRLGQFPKHGRCYEVVDVPDRSAILIHVANTILDLEGCIGVGKQLGTIHSLWGVLYSRDTFRELMNILLKHGEEHRLEIKNLWAS